MGNIITSEILSKFLDQAPEFIPYAEKFDLELVPNKEDPYERLLRVIVFQQLAGPAAQSIFNRFKELVGDFSPTNILAHSLDELRTAGLSRQKSGYIRNVAEAFSSDLEDYKSYTAIQDLPSNEIIRKFTSIKGVGDWTVQMYLIFAMGRLDIIPSNDLGVKKGVQKIYNLDSLPTPSVLRKHTSHWQPYGTIGSLFSWRIQDE
jgi:DNA-3-methyladenine glycosylase II